MRTPSWGRRPSCGRATVSSWGGGGDYAGLWCIPCGYVEYYTVGIWFIAGVTGGTPAPGDDLDAVAWFGLDEAPPLAFPTDAKVIAMLRELKSPAGGV